MARTRTDFGKRSSKTKSAGKTKPPSKGSAKAYGGAGQVCEVPEVAVRQLDADIDPHRLSLVRVDEKKWVNGTVLHYYFFDRPGDGSWVGPDNQRAAVRKAFKTWKDLGIGLEFKEVADREEAEVRIGFQRGAGSWSYVGRDVVDAAPDPNERTMNLGWNVATSSGFDTALHEIGHTLGLPHEHQNPNAGIEWNEEAVYESLGGPPNNWSRAKTFHNIIRKLDAAAVSGSAWDPNSIMHYPFEAGLIKNPARYRNGLNPTPSLSPRDKSWARKFYPPIGPKPQPELKPYQSRMLTIEPGKQVNLTIRPSFTRNYTIQTFGQSDVVMVLFEKRDGTPRFVIGDDDSGNDRNAKIKLRLYRDHEYVLRVRLYYARRRGETAIMMW